MRGIDAVAAGRTRLRALHACALLPFFAGCVGDNLAGEPPPAELVGTWRYLPKRSLGDVPLAERQVVEFAPDGSYEIRTPTGVQRGEFTVDGIDLTIDPGGGDWITTNFLATADRLLVDAMFPVAAVSGSSGMWRGTQSADAGESTVTLTLRADGQGALDQTGPARTSVEGTWDHVGDDLVFTYLTPTGNPIRKRYQEVVGVAVGEWLYERIP